MYLTLVLAALAAAGIVAPFCTFAERRALKDGHPIAELAAPRLDFMSEGSIYITPRCHGRERESSG